MTTEQLLAVSDTASLLGQDTAPITEDVLPIETALPLLDGTATESAPDETATVDPLADLDEEAVRQSPRVKALLEAHARDVKAGVDGEWKQRQETEARETRAAAEADAYSRNQAELDAVEQGSIAQTLYGLGAKLAQTATVEQANELVRAEWPNIQNMAAAVQRTANLRHDRLYLDATNAYLADQFPTYAIPPELVGRFDAALHAGDYGGRQKVLAEIIRDAVVKTEVPKERTKIAADLKKEAEAELKLTRDRAAEQTATGASRPTAVNGRAPAAGRQFTTRLEVAVAHSQGELTNAEARSWYARGLPET